MLSLPKRFIVKVDELIEENIDNENFSIETLQQALLISYSHLHRKIRKETGLSPSLYIRNKRLEYASMLIKETELNIIEIVYRVGFNSPTYFSKCFAEYYGHPPLRYRNLC